MPAKVLIDSGFLFALHNPGDANFVRAEAFADADNSLYIVPDVALTEVAYMLKHTIGQRAVLRFLDSLTEPRISLEPITVVDIRRARTIMATYSEARLDFVDCAIMALAERLDVTQVCTFDRRDFALVRPAHCDYLDLLP